MRDTHAKRRGDEKGSADVGILGGMELAFRPQCSIKGCAKESRVRGWCSMHYARWRIYKDPLHVKRPTGLSRNEQQVLFHIAHGWKNVDVAKQMGIAAQTVTTYRARLLEKLGLETDAEIAVYCFMNGITSWPLQRPGKRSNRRAPMEVRA